MNSPRHITETFAPRSASSPGKNPSWLYKRVGHFQLQAILGEGATGKVFRAEDLQLGRQVALKIISLPENSAHRNRAAELVLGEARLAAALDHPHIVRILEVNEAPRFCYIAMELIEGGNLNELVRSSGPMDYLRACQLTAEAAEALAYAHEQGVVHRDIKPANLMLSRGGRCKLADFGLAVLRSPGIVGATQGPAGTPQYVAPELIAGHDAGPAADIYSLGGTLCFLLTGKPPFSAGSAAEMLNQHLHGSPPDLASLRPDLPESLIRGIEKALQKAPAARFNTAGEFAQLLRVHTIPIGGAQGTSGSFGSSGLIAGAGSPPRKTNVRATLLWSGLAAVVGTALISWLVYWWSGGGAPSAHSSSSDASLPPIQAVAPPKVVHSTTIPSSDVFSASDASKLSSIAHGEDPDRAVRDLAVEGIVESNQISKKGKFFRISFVEAGDEGFCCTYNADVLPSLQSKFGSADGLALSGKRVRVIGRIQLNKNRPAIHIDNSEQIRILPATTQPATRPAGTERETD